jgi:hypothetical protein
MADALLERFHRVLVDEIRANRPDYLTGPFTVAEIYQNLVPYGLHRDRIGVEMNGDYEDALIRLLAGEGEYLLLDSEPALRDLRAELRRSSPNTGIYREFAAVDVRLNQDHVPRAHGDAGIDAGDVVEEVSEEVPEDEETHGGTPDELLASEPEVRRKRVSSAAPPDPGPIRVLPPGVDIFFSLEEAASQPAGAEQRGPGSRPPLAPEYVESSHADAGAAVEAESCGSCGERLPEREALRFCPFCGTGVRAVPCASCGEAVEPGWSFCIACGTRVSA